VESLAASGLGHRLVQPLADTAAVNATRYAVGRVLKVCGLPCGLPVSFWSGGRTKFNRTRQGYAKDPACVGESGAAVTIPPAMVPLEITATSRSRRRVRGNDRFGFPKGTPRQAKRVRGFQPGDLARLVCTKGKTVPGCMSGGSRRSAPAAGSCSAGTTNRRGGFNLETAVERPPGCVPQSGKAQRGGLVIDSNALSRRRAPRGACLGGRSDPQPKGDVEASAESRTSQLLASGTKRSTAVSRLKFWSWLMCAKLSRSGCTCGAQVG